MKKRFEIGFGILLGVLFLAMVSVYAIPKFRVTLFVNIYHERIEENLKISNGVPADDAVLFGYETVNHWNGTHPMTEFVIMTDGDTYYGCYYSPDDIPLAFQNTAVDLLQEGHNLWKWTAEGDNHGTTSKIRGNWYFFRASF